MPNKFGGDQDHPAYDPRRKLDPKTEFMHRDVLYTKVSEHEVERETITGDTQRFALSHPRVPIEVVNHFMKKANYKKRRG